MGSSRNVQVQFRPGQWISYNSMLSSENRTTEEVFVTPAISTNEQEVRSRKASHWYSFVGVVIVSLLSGASIVHNVYKPNLSLPPVESVDVAKKNLTGKE